MSLGKDGEHKTGTSQGLGSETLSDSRDLDTEQIPCNGKKSCLLMCNRVVICDLNHCVEFFTI